MSGPEIIKLDGATFRGPDFEERNRKAAAEGRADDASSRSAQERADAHARFLVELEEKGLELGDDGRPRPKHRVAAGDTTLTGEEYLKTLPADLAAKAKMLIDGRMPWPTAGAARSPQMQAIISAAVQADPTLDAANSATRVATRKDFTSGKSWQNMNAINTALKHIHTLAVKADALRNFGQPVAGLNTPVNAVMDWAGDPRYNDFRIARDAVASELTRVFRGTAGNLADIEEWKRNINEAQSPDQLRGAVKTAFELLNGRLTTMREGYSAAMGRSSDPYEFLKGEAKEYYKQLEEGKVFPSDNPESDAKHQDAFAKPPEGASVAGEDIRGYRFAGEQEQALRAYTRDPAFDPAKFADMAASFVEAGGVRTDDAWRANMAEQGKLQREFYAKNPEAADTPFDYSAVDKSATENAGLGDSLAQLARNAPESAYNLATGLTAPATDLLRSVVAGKPQGFYELGANLITKPGDTLKQIGDVYAEDYGGLPNIRRKAVRDPFGMAGDVSMAEAGVAGVARKALPGLPGVADALSASSRAIDPVSGLHRLMTRGAPSLYSRLPENMRHYAAELPAEIAALPSGVGGQTLVEGFNAGRSRGLAGAETPESAAFQANRRQEPGSFEDTVALAQQGVGNLRRQASRDYEAGMAELGQNPPQLSMESIFEKLNELKPAGYDTWTNFNGTRPPDHLAWERMRDGVVHYGEQATRNPKLLEPLQLDQLKQTLFDIGKSVPGQATEPSARRIAGQTREAVRGVIAEHDPSYRDTMANYGDAMDEVTQLEDTFALGNRRGGFGGPNVDSATRRLQSIFRNNANTNYGRRAQQGERLAELDTTGTLMPSLAGQSSSSWLPRGFRSSLTLGELAAHYLVNGGAGLGALAYLPAASPRLMGKASHAMGRAAGTAERVALPKLKALDAIYQKHPELVLTMQRAQAVQDREDEKRALAAKYGIEVPGAVDFGG